MNTRTITLWTTLGLALLLSACAPKNEGFEKNERIESRKPGEGPYLGSADLTVASDRAVEGIASVPDLRTVDGRTVIVMDRVENQTSDPSANFQIYLARIRAMLNQSGVNKHLVFIETRNKSDAIRQREGLPASTTQRSMPTYALTASFYDLPRRAANYYLLTFQMVDLTNDQVTWEGSYEVKLD